MPTKDTLAAAEVHRIKPISRGKATRVTLAVSLNGGTLTLQPRCRLADTDDSVLGAVLSTIEYTTPGAPSAGSTADISTAGLYEFLIDNKELVLTVSALTGTPVIGWELSES